MNSQPRTDAGQVAAFPDAKGRHGAFGGRYVPETLVPALDNTASQAPRLPRDWIGSRLERGGDVRAFLGSLR